MEHAAAGADVISDDVDRSKHDEVTVHNAGVFDDAAAAARIQAVDLPAAVGEVEEGGVGAGAADSGTTA